MAFCLFVCGIYGVFLFVFWCFVVILMFHFYLVFFLFCFVFCGVLFGVLVFWGVFVVFLFGACLMRVVFGVGVFVCMYIVCMQCDGFAVCGSVLFGVFDACGVGVLWCFVCVFFFFFLVFLWF